MYWIIYEMDNVVDETVSWSYKSSSTTTSEYDLSTIARHETGYASGLGHINDDQKLMYSYTSKGAKNHISSASAHPSIITKITHDKATTRVKSLSATGFSECYKQSFGIGASEQSTSQLYPNPASNSITLLGIKHYNHLRC